jgi:hypothetical protein
VATIWDEAELAAMCRWYAEWRRADEVLASCDESSRYRNTIAANLAFIQFERLAGKFGMNPRDRAQLDIHGTEPESKIAKFL